MQPRTTKCIYCGRFVNPRAGQGDHVLPAGLFGEFKNDLTFRGICVRCNNGFSHLEQLLAQGSPFGFYRRIAKPNRGRRKGRGLGFLRGSRGSSRPRFTVTFGDRAIVVYPSATDPQDVSAPDQLVVRDSHAKDHQILLFPGITREKLRAAILGLGIGEVKEAWLLCDPSASAAVQLDLAAVLPAAKIVEQGAIPPQAERTLVSGEYSFSGQYFQALAKIALHYYLVHNRRGYQGSEACFAEIRRFIKFGGDKHRFFHAAGRKFVAPFGRTPVGTYLCPKDWCHVLATNEIEKVIVVYMQLFLGPGFVPEPILVTLGPAASDVILRKGVWAHLFKYEPNRTGRYAGRVDDVRMFPIE